MDGGLAIEAYIERWGTEDVSRIYLDRINNIVINNNTRERHDPNSRHDGTECVPCD